MKYRVLIRRNADGEERWTGWVGDADDPGLIAFDWHENNHSCDCNRSLAFERASGASEEETWDRDRECGHTAFDVLRIERDDGAVLDGEDRIWA